MFLAATNDPVVAIRHTARRPALPVTMRRWLEQAWAHRQERRIEQAVIRLEHPGLLDDLREARSR